MLYMKTEDGKLIEIKPYVRIPRTFKLFSGVMLQLPQKLSISAVGKREKLMRMIKNPMTQYLPVNSRKVGLSYSSEKLVSIQKYVAAAENNMDLVFVEYGAYKKGSFDKMLADDNTHRVHILAHICAAWLCE
ncbi:ribosomal RNA small subunit methyltransferase NEP1-like [Rosa rugosa]|uniref:ribosomal RNA small subunit methyltransferase NEP1-like n=1 Tax=Rosa rugosa TaxID=74645 RepID=UPI002B401A63|nr:ribosomal RNA small subunit methyltransferase NEP1-like [Rosa rugosa]